jgi:hypothetical protein
MKPIDLSVTEYWLGHGELHAAPEGHSQWVEDELGYLSEEDAIEYDIAEASGYNRVVVSKFTRKIYVEGSVRRPTWESLSPTERLAMEDLAFAHGIPVFFKGREVIEVRKEEQAYEN